MKKLVVLFALACAVGAFVSQPSADVTRHATMDVTSMLATVQPPHSLPTEAYQAI